MARFCILPLICIPWFPVQGQDTQVLSKEVSVPLSNSGLQVFLKPEETTSQSHNGH